MKILAVILALNTLVASTGVTLYTHLCKASSHMSISLVEMDCGGGAEAGTCCSTAIKHGRTEGKDNCCENHGAYYKTDIHALVSLQAKFTPDMPVISVPFCIMRSVPEAFDRTSFISHSYHPPDAATGPSLSEIRVLRC